jgi:ribosomal protein S18 acetylase RimI-like enzyme
MMLAVRHATPAHARSMATLLQEMDAFYGEAAIQSVSDKVRDIAEVLFSDQPLAHALIYLDDDRVIGFAAYSFLWPAVSTTKSLYLKELYVAISHRNMGIGKTLMKFLFSVAVAAKCSRVEWTTDQSNSDAQRFYAQLGISQLDSKVFYRIEGAALADAARSPGGEAAHDEPDAREGVESNSDLRCVPAEA